MFNNKLAPMKRTYDCYVYFFYEMILSEYI